MMRQILILAIVGMFIVKVPAQEFSARYELDKVGPAINTKNFHEVAPIISGDGKKLYFLINNHPDNTFGKDNSQDIWVSNLDDKGIWSQAKRMTSPLNQNRYNQVFNVLPDGSLFVRGGRSKGSKGFSIVSPSGAWKELNILDYEKMDKGQFYGASISADAKHVIAYFSETPGSTISDLYIASELPDGSWPKMIKLSISTGANEFGPFIGPDQNSLYFASDRYVPTRVGNTDIYKTTRLDDTWTKWSEPVNMGKAVNTPFGDAYFSLDSKGNVFTSRIGSLQDGGNFDIYVLKPRDIKIMLHVSVLSEKTQAPVPATVELKMKDKPAANLKVAASGKYETRIADVESYTVSATAAAFLPKESSFKMPKISNDTTLEVVLTLSEVAKPLVVSGNVYDKKTKQPLNAKVDMVSRVGGSSFSNQTADGKFAQTVSNLGWYVMSATAEGYLNATDSVNLPSADASPATKDLFLAPIEVGATVRLKNIYFDFDKTSLKSESYTELNKVVDFLKLNSTVEIEIEGHTDNKGSDVYNQNLSQGRSQSVVDYLAQQGIDNGRLKALGFGESKPIDNNETEDGRANNRRVEFTILKK